MLVDFFFYLRRSGWWLQPVSLPSETLNPMCASCDLWGWSSPLPVQPVRLCLFLQKESPAPPQWCQVEPNISYFKKHGRYLWHWPVRAQQRRGRGTSC